MSKSFFSGLGATLAKEAGRSESAPFVYGIFGAFLLLPKFAYDESNYAESYWIKQYRPELLPQTESHDSHAAPQTEDEKLMTETVARLKKIEAALGIEN